MGRFVLVLIAVAVVLAAILIHLYNRLVVLRNAFKTAFAQIDVELKRRYDLIPNLVETAKGYLKHERETLESVVSARNQAYEASRRAAANPADAATMNALMQAEGRMTGILGRLMAVVEAYPDLKANQNMMHLSAELASTENRLATARQSYNGTVMSYNTARESFPAVVFSGMLGFQAAPLFQVESPEQRVAPKVSFT